MKTSHLYVWISFLFLLAASFTSRAQDSNPGATPPPPPYVGVLSGNFHLVKNFTYATPDASTTPDQKAQESIPTNPLIVDAVKSGAIRKDIETLLDGTVRTIWRVQAYRITTYKSHPDGLDFSVAASPTDSPLLGRNVDPTDFPELAWIGKNMFQGIQDEQGKKCYVYKSGDQTAWVSVDNKLPVYLASKVVRVTYTYSDAPDVPLQLPPGYAEKLEKYKRAMRGQG